MQNSREHAEGQEQRAAAKVADQVQRDRRALGRPDGMQRAGQREVIDVVTRHLRVGSALAPTRHASVHQPRVARESDVRPETQPLHDARTMSLDERIRLLDQLQRRFAALRATSGRDDRTPPARFERVAVDRISAWPDRSAGHRAPRSENCMPQNAHGPHRGELQHPQPAQGPDGPDGAVFSFVMSDSPARSSNAHAGSFAIPRVRGQPLRPQAMLFDLVCRRFRKSSTKAHIPRQHEMRQRGRRNSSSSAGSSVAPRAEAMIASTSSSLLRAGTATTAASCTSGCMRIALSTSNDEMFSPRRRRASLVAVDEEVVAVRFTAQEVAGVEPAVAPGAGGCLGIPVIAVTHRPGLIGPHDQLSCVPGRHFDVVLVDEPQLDSRPRLAAESWLRGVRV